jgi:hypothetical protein
LRAIEFVVIRAAQEQVAARCEHARHLEKRCAAIGHVLQHVAHVDEVEAGRG